MCSNPDVVCDTECEGNGLEKKLWEEQEVGVWKRREIYKDMGQVRARATKP